MSVKDGGPAFPNWDATGDGYSTMGMTLRDYFAGQALAELAEHPDGSITAEKNAEWVRSIVARCYAIADAMLAAREARP